VVGQVVDIVAAINQAAFLAELKTLLEDAGSL